MKWTTGVMGNVASLHGYQYPHFKKNWVVLTHFGCFNFVYCFPHHWTISFIKHIQSPMILNFTNVLETLITVWNVEGAVGLHCVFNDAGY